MSKKNLIKIPLWLGAVLLLSGCAFNRTLINPGTSDLNTAFIKVGQTTTSDVLDTLGCPSPIVNKWEYDRRVSERHLRYTTIEVKKVQFVLGYLLMFPFKWADAQIIEELLIEFNEAGTVSGVYRTSRDTIWSPLQSEEKRAPLEFRDLTGSLK
jgi:hypothetical protein